MSYIQSTVECIDCKRQFNVAFGIVGMTQIAEWPKDCPYCHGALKEISQGWNAKENDKQTP